MEQQVEARARRMWRAVEPVHTVTYFAPESRTACDALGTKGFWMSYFALRSAPLGPGPAELVTALFYSFHPAMVARAVPDVWAAAAPERFVAARLESVDAALHRLLGAELLGSPEVAEAAGIARDAASAAPTAGRALAAANAALDWPEAPHLVLWHAQTVLREHRGDGHVAALLIAGLDPVEALVVFAAGGSAEAAKLRERRGWSDQEWAGAVDRLASRGLLDGTEVITDAGRAVVAEVESHTDALADVPWATVGDARAERLVGLVEPLVAGILAGGGFMVDNPMGLRPLGPPVDPE
jgi:hypothetical protein